MPLRWTLCSFIQSRSGEVAEFSGACSLRVSNSTVAEWPNTAMHSRSAAPEKRKTTESPSREEDEAHGRSIVKPYLRLLVQCPRAVSRLLLQRSQTL